MGIQKCRRVRNQLVGFLIENKTKGKSILVVSKYVSNFI